MLLASLCSAQQHDQAENKRQKVKTSSNNNNNKKILSAKVEQKEWTKLQRQVATNDRYAELNFPVMAPHVLQGVRFDPACFRLFIYSKHPAPATSHAMYSRKPGETQWVRFNSGHFSKIKTINHLIHQRCVEENLYQPSEMQNQEFVARVNAGERIVIAEGEDKRLVKAFSKK